MKQYTKAERWRAGIKGVILLMLAFVMLGIAGVSIWTLLTLLGVV